MYVAPADQDPIIREAIVIAGGRSRLAEKLKAIGQGIAPQAISQWRRVPSERVLGVEQVTGISRFKLRPDLYPSDGITAPSGEAA